MNQAHAELKSIFNTVLNRAVLLINKGNGELFEAQKAALLLAREHRDTSGLTKMTAALIKLKSVRAAEFGRFIREFAPLRFDNNTNSWAFKKGQDWSTEKWAVLMDTPFFTWAAPDNAVPKAMSFEAVYKWLANFRQAEREGRAKFGSDRDKEIYAQMVKLCPEV